MTSKTTAFAFLFAFVFSGIVFAQSVSRENKAEILPPGLADAGQIDELKSRTVIDERVRRYLLPKQIVWKSDKGLVSENKILEPVSGQTSTAAMNDGFFMEYKADQERPAGILLDFGAQIHGGIRLESRNLNDAGVGVGKTVRLRVRFGESADEAMSEIGEKGSMNDHSVRDMIVTVPWLGAIEFGESAFRFVRLDLVDKGTSIRFDSVRAVFVYRDLPWLGSFQCSDERLNTIWRVAAHTQHLNMQGYVIEGAKRDRLVWYGDIYPQTMTTLAVWGAPDVLKDTLGNYARKTWPLPKWMNGMPNYSLWWLISVGDLFRYDGDVEYLKEQREYIEGLFEQLCKHVAEDGRASFEHPFLDWPTKANRPALDAGTHAMFALGFDRIKEIAEALGNETLAKKAAEMAAQVRRFVPDHVGNKQAASLMALAGLENSDKPNIDVVAADGPKGFSTFYGYYMLEALGDSQKEQLAIDVIRQYWGAMIDRGATSFWEDFDLDWLDGSGRIDTITPDGTKSLHGDYGAYCYIGFRHSLCHGWASGPAPWLNRYVLGVRPSAPGFRKVSVKPFLGDLDWAEGTVPTPHGIIKVRHEKQADGTIKTTIDVPPEVDLEQ